MPVYTSSLNDSITITDSISRLTLHAVSDVLSIADSISRLTSHFLADTVTLIEIFLANHGFPSTLTDTLSITDSIGRAIGKSLTDVVTLSDVYARAILRLRSFSDSVSLSDSIMQLLRNAAGKRYIVTFLDSAVVSDSNSYLSNLLDSISLADTLSTITTRFPVLKDTLTLVETLLKNIGIHVGKT